MSVQIKTKRKRGKRLADLMMKNKKVTPTPLHDTAAFQCLPAVGRCQETVAVGYKGFGHVGSEQNPSVVLIKKKRNPSAVGRCQETVAVGY